MFTAIRRIIITAIRSLWRNRWLSLAAVLMMILTLFTISFFAGLLVVTNKTTESLREKVDISVYFNESTPKEQIFSLQNILLTRSDIKSVEYVSKEQALEIWRERNKDNEKIRNVISESDNPLPRSLDIKTEKPENLENIYNFLTKSDYQNQFKEISYRKNKDLIDKLVRITYFVKLVGWIVSALFAIVSILIVYNTIRLALFSRSSEIEIMRLVGASDLYVQGPFLIEGISYGIMASIVTSVIFYLAFKVTFERSVGYLGVNIDPSSLGLNLWFILAGQLVVSLVLGAFSSILAVKKYIR